MAPRVGFEPTTLRLTAGCSRIRLGLLGKAVNYLINFLGNVGFCPSTTIFVSIVAFLVLKSNTSIPLPIVIQNEGQNIYIDRENLLDLMDAYVFFSQICLLL